MQIGHNLAEQVSEICSKLNSITDPQYVLMLLDGFIAQFVKDSFYISFYHNESDGYFSLASNDIYLNLNNRKLDWHSGIRQHFCIETINPAFLEQIRDSYDVNKNHGFVIHLGSEAEHGMVVLNGEESIHSLKDDFNSDIYFKLFSQSYTKLRVINKINQQTNYFHEQLCELTKQARLFQELASEWMWSTDENHVFQKLNMPEQPADLYTTLFIGRTAIELCSESEKKQLKKWSQFRYLLDSHKDFLNFEFLIQAEDKLKWISMSGKAQFNTEKEFTGYLGIAKDISFSKERELDLKLAKEKAEQANLAKSQFLAVMSHEIRTPMNAVIGMLELIQDEGLSSQQSEWLEYAQSSANLLQGLISDVLDFSKIESGTVKLNIETIDLKQLLKALEAQFQLRSKETGIKLECDFDEALPTYVKADSTRLNQVLFNLLGNAFKYTSYGVVTIKAHFQENTSFLYVSVNDTGVGIAENDIPKLFKPFSQVSDNVKRTQQGVGLGLSITKRLVDLMEGEIDCQSTLGVGSCFSVNLPIEVDKSYKNKKVTSSCDVCLNLNILVAEDNKANQVLIQALLSKQGHTVTLAENGSEALNQVSRNNFDLILMDMMMPVMDGLHATEYIRSEMGLNIPIFALTANAGTDDKKRCLEAGMDKVLTKPIQIPKLNEALHSIYSE